MFRNNKINMVISIVVAIILWVYVVGQVNPATTKKITDIPIAFAGEEILNEKGLAVANIETTQLTVTLKGNRAALMTMEGKDVVATADLSKLTKGKNSVAVTVKVPEGTELEKSSVETVDVTVEDRVVESKEVKVTFKEGMKDGSEPGQVTAVPKTIEVSGARSTVDRVAYIQATVGADQVKDGRIEADVGCTPVDAGGTKVEHVLLSQNKAHIVGVVMEKKTVDLKVTTVGDLPQGYFLDSVQVNKQITIKGPPDVLSQIQEVQGDPLNITGLTTTTRIPVTINLPQGAEVAEESKNLQAVVTIKDMSASKLTFSSSKIKVNNLKDGLKISVKDGQISVAPKEKDGSAVTLSLKDIDPHIDVKGLEPGTQKVKILAAPLKEGESVVFSPDVVEVTISEV